MKRVNCLYLNNDHFTSERVSGVTKYGPVVVVDCVFNRKMRHFQVLMTNLLSRRCKFSYTSRISSDKLLSILNSPLCVFLNKKEVSSNFVWTIFAHIEPDNMANMIKQPYWGKPCLVFFGNSSWLTLIIYPEAKTKYPFFLVKREKYS